MTCNCSGSLSMIQQRWHGLRQNLSWMSTTSTTMMRSTDQIVWTICGTSPNQRSLAYPRDYRLWGAVLVLGEEVDLQEENGSIEGRATRLSPRQGSRVEQWKAWCLEVESCSPFLSPYAVPGTLNLFPFIGSCSAFDIKIYDFWLQHVRRYSLRPSALLARN